MSELEALILGIVQGLTEYLPVSSSGHLVVGASFREGIPDPDANLQFAVMVHAATALSSIIIFRSQIAEIFRDLFQFKWNDGTRYAAMLALSAIPVVAVGLVFKDELDAAFEGNVGFVGWMWLVTGVLLLLTRYVKTNDGKLGFFNTMIVGLAQAVAVLPGISRSGATIATGLLLRIDRETIARFSFLMVIVPIMGKAALDTKKMLFPDAEEAAQVAASSMEAMPLLIGFVAAFITGLIACRAMLGIVKKDRLPWFSAYCFVIGTIAILKGAEVF